LLFFVFAWLGLEDSLLSLVGLIGGAVLGAYLLMAAGRWMIRKRSSEAN
jgi:amino acid transporter